MLKARETLKLTVLKTGSYCTLQIIGAIQSNIMGILNMPLNTYNFLIIIEMRKIFSYISN